jgi:hypothetical protein
MTDKVRAWDNHLLWDGPTVAEDEDEFQFRLWYIEDSAARRRYGEGSPTLIFARQCLEDVRSVLHGEAD